MAKNALTVSIILFLLTLNFYFNIFFKFYTEFIFINNKIGLPVLMSSRLEITGNPPLSTSRVRSSPSTRVVTWYAGINVIPNYGSETLIPDPKISIFSSVIPMKYFLIPKSTWFPVEYKNRLLLIFLVLTN